MNEETLRILKMVEEGKLSADKAKELMEAMNLHQANVPVAKKYEDKFLRVKVLSAQGDKVNVQLPIKVIREVMRVTGKLPIQANGMENINLEELMNTIITCLDHEAMGEIVNVESTAGDIVKVVIE